MTNLTNISNHKDKDTLESVERITPTTKKEWKESSDKKASREYVLNTALECVNGSRESDHGSPESTFQTHAELWTAYIKGKTGLDLDLKACDVAAMMVLFKVGRMAANPGHVDNWVDAAGYSACGGELSC